MDTTEIRRDEDLAAPDVDGASEAAQGNAETGEVAPDPMAAGDESPGLPEAAGDAPTPDASLEAVLFSCEEPLTPIRLAQLVGVRKGEVLEAIDRLNVFYGEHQRSFRIVPLAGGFQLVTTPEHAELLARLHKEKVASKLSRAALETLSIIAFKQPVTRAEVDAIRGVSASDGVIRHLMERNLVRIAGRAEAPGRPLLYGTTREFLAHFGLHAVTDLPRTSELAALLAGETRTVPVDEEELEAQTPKDELTAAQVVASRWQDAEDLEDEESHSGEESDEDGGAAAPQ
jgi:segregation and condensation protein B